METTAIKPGPLRLLPLAVVEDRTGFRKSKIYELLKTPGAFPRPVKAGRSIRFVDTEINAWVAARIAERDALCGTAAPVLVTETEVAAVLNVSVSYLQKDRLKQQPTVPFVRVGPHVRYDLDAVRDSLRVRA